MIILPLFGKDSVPHYQSRFIGAIGTFVLWIILLLLFILIGPKNKKEKPQPIQIVLEPTEPLFSEIIELTQASEHSTSNNHAESEKTAVLEAEIKMDSEIKENVVAKAEIKSEKTNTKDNKVNKNTQKDLQNNTYAQSVEELFAKQTEKPKKTAVWDESAFEKSNTSVSKKENTQPQKVATQNTFSGSAANSITKDTNATSAVKKDLGQTSTETNNALSNITKASETTNSSNGKNQITSINTSTITSQNLKIQMEGGGARGVIGPISINLSKKAEEQIIGVNSITVKISFKVDLNGYVVPGSVNIQGAFLASQVKNEISSQILKWRFEPASFMSNAYLDFTIIKK